MIFSQCTPPAFTLVSEVNDDIFLLHVTLFLSVFHSIYKIPTLQLAGRVMQLLLYHEGFPSLFSHLPDLLDLLVSFCLGRVTVEYGVQKDASRVPSPDSFQQGRFTELRRTLTN